MPPKPPNEVKYLMPLIQGSSGWCLVDFGDPVAYPMWDTILGSFKAVQSNGEFLDRKFAQLPDDWSGNGLTIQQDNTLRDVDFTVARIEQKIDALNLDALNAKLDKIIYMLDHRAQ